MPQRNQRIDVRRAFGRQQARQQRDGREQRGDSAEREGIGRFDRKQHGLKEASQSERTKQSRANPPSTPAPTPKAMVTAPSSNAILRMSVGCAPMATRMPISLVRRLNV